MQPSQDHNQNPTSSPESPRKSSFSPFLTKDTLKIKDILGIGFGFGKGSAYYHQKTNTIVAYPGAMDEIQFYNASTLTFQGRRRLEEFESATCISYNQEANTYVIGCQKGWKSHKTFIYSFYGSGGSLTKVKKCKEDVYSIAFMNSNYFAFSCYGSTKLDIGSLDQKRKTFKFYSYNQTSFCLYQMTNSHLLLSGLADGSMVVYWTKNLPKMKIMERVEMDRTRKPVNCVQSVVTSGKEYVITATQDNTLKIWALVKGKMRILKVIQTENAVKSLVYLESYKMIVTGDQSDQISFWRFLSGKLEKTVSLSKSDTHRLFLMKGKNMLGVVPQKNNEIKFIQLSE